MLGLGCGMAKFDGRQNAISVRPILKRADMLE